MRVLEASAQHEVVPAGSTRRAEELQAEVQRLRDELAQARAELAVVHEQRNLERSAVEAQAKRLIDALGVDVRQAIHDRALGEREMSRRLAELAASHETLLAQTEARFEAEVARLVAEREALQTLAAAERAGLQTRLQALEARVADEADRVGELAAVRQALETGLATVAQGSTNALAATGAELAELRRSLDAHRMQAKEDVALAVGAAREHLDRLLSERDAQLSLTQALAESQARQIKAFDALVRSRDEFVRVARARLAEAAAGPSPRAPETAISSKLFLTSTPKSGTHFMVSILERLLSGPLDRIDKLNEGERLDEILQSRSSDCAYGHIPWEPAAELGRDWDVAVLIRDPRDLLVSARDYYVNPRQKSEAHQRIEDHLTAISRDDQYRFLIDGFEWPDYILNGIERHCRVYLDWRDHGARVLRYEDLFTKAAGRCMATAFPRAGFTEAAAREAVAGQRGAPTKTLNVGRPGRWKEELSPAVLAYFQERTGDLVTDMGYAV